jgi:hypothetical protein
MNDDQFEDLKQFIDSRISQAENTFGSKLDVELSKLRKEMLDGFEGVGEAIEEINKHFDDRLAKLEPGR